MPIVELALQPTSDATRIRSGTFANTNYVTNATQVVGCTYTSGANINGRVLLQWDDFSTIPAGATIVSAKVMLYEYAQACDRAGSETDAAYLHRVSRNWVGSQATWNSWSTGNAWSVAGCDGAADRAAVASSSAQFPRGGDPRGWVEFTGLEADVRGFIDGTLTNNGWILSCPTKTNLGLTDNRQFRSSAYTDDLTLRPKLVIEYHELSLDLTPAWTVDPATAEITGEVTATWTESVGSIYTLERSSYGAFQALDPNVAEQEEEVTVSATDDMDISDPPVNLNQYLYFGSVGNPQPIRTLVKFDIPSSLYQPVSARLRLYLEGPTTPTTAFVTRLKRAWSSLSTTWSSPWETPGASADSDRASVASSSAELSSTGWRTFTGLIDDVLHFIAHPDENHGWLLTAPTLESQNLQYGFFSSLIGGATYAPRLVLGYTIPPTFGSPYVDDLGVVEYGRTFTYRLTEVSESGTIVVEASVVCDASPPDYMTNNRPTSDKWRWNQLADFAARPVVRIEFGDRAEIPNVGTARWVISNENMAGNLVEFTLKERFDPTSLTLPFPEGQLKFVNGIDATGEANALYAFDDPTIKAAALKPTVFEIYFGVRYDDGTTEYLRMVSLEPNNFKVDNDNLYVEFDLVSLTNRLDEHTFYLGRPWGLFGDFTPLSGVIEEILLDAEFQSEGTWNYVLGQPECKVYGEVDPLPLWSDAAFSHWAIDPELDNIGVGFWPTPPVSHREALALVCSYGYVFMNYEPDGSLRFSRSLSPATDYTFFKRNMYGRPTREEPIPGREYRAQLTSMFPEGSVGPIVDSLTLTSPQEGGTATYRITHDACDISTKVLTLTGASLVGSPWGGNYATYFEANADTPGGSFDVQLVADRLVKNTYEHRAIMNTGAKAIVEFDIPVAFGATFLEAFVFDRYQEVNEATIYSFTVRDDPSLSVGTQCYLELEDVVPIQVMVTELTRKYGEGAMCDVKAIYYQHVV